MNSEDPVDSLKHLPLHELRELRKRALSANELTDAAATLIGSYTDKLNSVNTSGVIRQALLMSTAVCCGLAAYFLILRPHLAAHLAPRTTQKTRIGRRINQFVQTHFSSDGYISRVWLAIQEFYNSMTMPEHEMLLTSGLDAVAYLRMLWMTFQIFFSISLITFPTLLPLDWKAHNKGKLLDNVKIANISLKDFTITGVKDKTLYYHIAAGYAITVLVLTLMWWNSRCLARLRETFYTSPAYLDLDADSYKRCVMVTDLGGSSKEATDKIKKKVSEITDLEGVPWASHVFKVDDPPARAERMEQRNTLVLTLEKVITDWLEACKEAERTGQSPKYPEPMMRPIGAMAWSRPQIPALPYIRDELVTKWKAATHDKWTPFKYAFIAFPAVGNSSAFLRGCSTHRGGLGLAGWELDFAPTSNGILWSNIGMNAHLRGPRKLVGYALLVFLIVIYTPPLAGIALLSNVGAVTSYSKTLSHWSTAYPTLFAGLTATLPPALSATMFSILPKIIHGIAFAQGAKTAKALQARIMNWHLGFLVLAQLIVFPSLSTIFTLVTDDVSGRNKDPNASAGKKLWLDIVYFLTQIPMTYQQQANYWLNWLAMRWLLIVFQLAQGPLLLKNFFIRFYRHLTARENEKVQASPAEYSIHVPQGMFLLALGLIYAPLVPFISAFATGASFLLFVIHQVQACILYSTESETGGRWWLHAQDLVLLFMLLSQGMLALTCALQSADLKKAMLVAPICFATAFFRFVFRGNFNKTLYYVETPVATVKTCMRPNIDLEELKDTWNFEPKGIKLVFREDLREAAHHLLRENNLHPLVEIEDVDDEEKVIKGPKGALGKFKRVAKLAGKAGVGIVKGYRNAKKRDIRAPAPGFEDEKSASSSSTAKAVTKVQPTGTAAANASAQAAGTSANPEKAIMQMLPDVREDKRDVVDKAGGADAVATAVAAFKAAQKLKNAKNRTPKNGKKDA